MREIPLSCGLVALVDDPDYELVAAAAPWHAKRKGPRIYAHRNVRRADGAWTTQKMHVLITGLTHLDHRNGNGLDNQRANLRPATHGQNAANDRLRADSMSGFKGVSRSGRRWRARIVPGGREIYLGLFDTPEAAARAYDAAALELFGEFARINYPGDKS